MSGGGGSARVSRFPRGVHFILFFYNVAVLVVAAATDPYAFFDWDVGYVAAAPLGVKQQANLASILLGE
uniref:Uncharacterized protein n=1 Tax=Oryza meridionalis TaxID=40149 RepID=A0A0E0EZQ9_9ORYZ